MRKPILYITVGISASGKSTWADKKVQEDASKGITVVNINRDTIRFNDVLPGSDWSTYKFTKAREQAVSEIALQQFNDAVAAEYDIIISDTNLNEVYRNAWVERGEENGYQVEIVDFPITLEEAWKRDAARVNGVGHNTIYQQYKQWEEYKGVKKYAPDESKPKAIIVDVDGTIANKCDRSPFEWDKVGCDTPRLEIINMIRAFARSYGATPIFLSGRDSVCRDITQGWINCHAYMDKDQELYMRAEGDMRKDTIVKEELFWEHVEPIYNVIAAFDDRPCVVRKWHSIGIPNVIAVADQHIEF